MRELRIQLGARRAAPPGDHLWRFATAPAGSEVPWHGRLPAAERCLLIIPAERVTLLEVDLPAISARQLKQALPYLAEGHLIEPVERYELLRWPGERDSGRLRLLAFEKDWLAEIHRQVGSIDQGTVDWVMAGTQWRLPQGVWGLRGDGERLLLRCGEARCLPLAPEALPALLALLLDEARAGGPARPAALWHCGLTAERREALRAALLPHRVEAVEVGDDELPPAIAGDYSQAPVVFRQTHSSLRRALFELMAWQRWKQAMIVAAAIALLEVGGPLIQWARLSAELADLRTQSTAAFRSVAGATAVVVDPWLQLRRLYRSLRHAKGEGVSDDFLPLLDRLTLLLPESGLVASEIRYEHGMLDLILAGPAMRDPKAWFPRLREALAAAGFQAVLAAEPEGRGTLRVTLR
jgi:hypothetical protein